MADSVSETDVKNAALALVGEAPLTGSNDDSTAQLHSKLLYKFARNECHALRIEWAFCRVRTSIAAHADDPEHGSYDYQFVLPSLCLRVRRLQESTYDDVEYPFSRELMLKTEGSSIKEYPVILANVSTAYIVYTRLVTDPNMWPAYFTKLVYTRLAIMLCEPLKQDKTKKEQLRSMYVDALAEAKAANGTEDCDVNEDNTNKDKGNNDVLNAAIDDAPQGRYIINRTT